MSVIDPNHADAHLGLPFTHCDRLEGGECRPEATSLFLQLSDDETWTSGVYTHGAGGNWSIVESSHPHLFEIQTDGRIRLPQDANRWNAMSLAYRMRWATPGATQAMRTSVSTANFAGAGVPPMQFLAGPPNFGMWSQSSWAHTGSHDYVSAVSTGVIPMQDYTSEIEAGMEVYLWSWPIGTTHTVRGVGASWFSITLWNIGA